MNYLNKIFKILTSIIFFLLVHNNVFAQNKNIIKLNCTDFIISRYSMGFERNIANSFALAIDLDFISQNKTLESNHPFLYPLLMATKKGYVIEPQLRFYFKSIVLEGLYTSFSGIFGYAEYKPYNNSGYIENDDWSSLGASLSLGYQILILRRIALDIFFGCTLADDNYPQPYFESTVLVPAPDGVRPSGGIKLGFIF